MSENNNLADRLRKINQKINNGKGIKLEQPIYEGTPPTVEELQAKLQELRGKVTERGTGVAENLLNLMVQFGEENSLTKGWKTAIFPKPMLNARVMAITAPGSVNVLPHDLRTARRTEYLGKIGSALENSVLNGIRENLPGELLFFFDAIIQTIATVAWLVGEVADIGETLAELAVSLGQEAVEGVLGLPNAVSGFLGGLVGISVKTNNDRKTLYELIKTKKYNKLLAQKFKGIQWDPATGGVYDDGSGFGEVGGPQPWEASPNPADGVSGGGATTNRTIEQLKTDGANSAESAIFNLFASILRRNQEVTWNLIIEPLIDELTNQAVSETKLFSWAEAHGWERGRAVHDVEIKNVTETSFEWFAHGKDKLEWIAIGFNPEPVELPTQINTEFLKQRRDIDMLQQENATLRSELELLKQKIKTLEKVFT